MTCQSDIRLVGRSVQYLVKSDVMYRLNFGDNLKWFSDRKEFPDASVDLVQLDPPSNSNADYNVLFRERLGHQRFTVLLNNSAPLIDQVRESAQKLRD